MKNKKMVIGKAVIAASVATSVVAVANPAQAASTSTAEKAVKKAETLAKSLKNEISYDSRKTKNKKSVYGLPSSKVVSDTKKAVSTAKKEVKKLKKGKTRTLLETKIKSVEKTITYSTYYSDAVKEGLKIQAKYKLLKAKYDKGTVDSTTVKYYNELTAEVKKNGSKFDKVYGEKTRTQLKKYYKSSADTLLKNLASPVTIKNEIDKAKTALKSQKIESAAINLANVDYYITQAKKKGQKQTTKIMKGALKDLKTTLATFNKYGVLYIAKSTKESEPTTFGPATGTQKVTKTVFLFAGKGEYIKLRNTEIEGNNLFIKGTKTGSGNVSLDGVKVVKTTAGTGQIIVDDVADHSLEMANTEADTLSVNDPNGSNFVADKGVYIKTFVVTNAAGEKGTVTIEAKSPEAFADIKIETDAKTGSEGIVLKGDLSGATITITGQNANVSVAKDTKIKELVVDAAAKINLAEGSSVQEVKKGSNVPSDAKIEIDNKGTVVKAPEDIPFIGNKPVEVVPVTPTTPGGGNQEQTRAAVTSVGAIINNVVPTNYSIPYSTTIPSSSTIMDLSAANGNFTGIKVNFDMANSNKAVLQIQSVVAGSLINLGQTNFAPINIYGTGTVVKDLTAYELFKISNFSDGVYLSTLRSLASNVRVTASLTFYNGATTLNTQYFDVTLNLGSSNAPVQYEDSHTKIVKTGNSINMEIKDGNISINSYINGILTNQGLAYLNSIKTAIDLFIASKPGVTLDSKLSDLVPMSQVVDGLTITVTNSK